MATVEGQGPDITRVTPSFLSGPSLVFHGGLCCGIKTIYGFPYTPSYPCGKLGKIDRDDRDQSGLWVSSTTRFFHEEAPAETALERVKRYLDYMKKRRPANIVEVVLTEDQLEGWEEDLVALGFKESIRGRNSNSGNTCVILHLVIDEWDGGDDDEEEEYYPDDEYDD